jgi:hypothetical protein
MSPNVWKRRDLGRCDSLGAKPRSGKGVRFGSETRDTAFDPQKAMAATRLALGWADHIGVIDKALISCGSC